MLGSFGSAFSAARRARDPKRIAEAMRDVPAPVLRAAQRQRVVWRLDAHPADCVEDPKLITACAGVHFLDLSNPPAEPDKLNQKLGAMFGGTDAEVEDLKLLLRWLASRLGGPETKAYWLAKRLDELAGMAGFPGLMDLLKSLPEGGWSPEQVDALDDVRRLFRIG